MGNDHITVAAPLAGKDKPVVRYRGTATAAIGRSAFLHPIDHPNHLRGHDVSNTRVVRTSAVIDFDAETGRIETMNTIYLPEAQ